MIHGPGCINFVARNRDDEYRRMNLNELIIELLYTHDCVVIPGVGGFLLNYVPATIHPVQHLFSPPSRTVAFNSALQINDGVIASAWAMKTGLGYQRALEAVRSFAVDLNLKLQTTGSYRFEGIGRLVDKGDGLVHFEPEKSVNLLGDAFGLPSFTSPAINRGDYHNVSQTTRVDRKPSRKPARLPVAARWVLMLLPVIVVGVWFFLNPVTSPNDAGKANLGFEVSGSGTTVSVDTASSSLVPEVMSDSVTHTTEPGGVDGSGESAPQMVVPEPQVPASGGSPKIVASQLVTTELAGPVTEGGYHIIAGCFSDETNATNFVQVLRDRGYESSLQGTTRSGLFRVSIGHYSSYRDATAALDAVRSGVNSGAWLLKN